jgi:hypothetical protein
VIPEEHLGIDLSKFNLKEPKPWSTINDSFDFDEYPADALLSAGEAGNLV